MHQLDDIRIDFGLRCSPENQWLLLYFGTVLGSSWNILEALATTSMLYTILLRDKNYVLARVRTEFFMEIRAALGDPIGHTKPAVTIWNTKRTTLWFHLTEDGIALVYPKVFKGIKISGREVLFLETSFDGPSRRFKVGELFEFLNTVVATTLAAIL